MKFVLLVLVSFLVLVDSAPRVDKRHAMCITRVFKSLNELCNHQGDLKVLKVSAIRCCHTNCDLMEMMSVCTLKPDTGDDDSSEESNKF